MDYQKEILENQIVIMRALSIMIVPICDYKNKEAISCRLLLIQRCTKTEEILEDM